MAIHTAPNEMKFYLNLGAGLLLGAFVSVGIYNIILGLRNGAIIMTMVRARGGGILVTRGQNPIAFWFCIFLYSFGAIGGVGAAYYWFTNRVFS